MTDDLALRTEKLEFPNRPARRIEVDFYKSGGKLRVVHDISGSVMDQWDLTYRNGLPENPNDKFFKEAIEDCMRIAQTYDLKYKHPTRNAIAELNPVKIVKEAYEDMVGFFEKKIEMMALYTTISSLEEADSGK